MPGYDKFGLPCRLYWEQGGEGVQVVYVDVLLVVNFFMTLLLLLLTAALTKQPGRTGRLCIAAMLGAAYSLILLAPKLPTCSLKSPLRWYLYWQPLALDPLRNTCGACCASLLPILSCWASL